MLFCNGLATSVVWQQQSTHTVDSNARRGDVTAIKGIRQDLTREKTRAQNVLMENEATIVLNN